ncbi:DUF559 domain-containing protein [Sinomonas halotolerans]|uniref:DUF559 domain-containing protein n=1 Tax=Sinomonas halotolerans TaxID=1644133 RepID=A0ABU9X1S4_9MICC
MDHLIAYMTGLGGSASAAQLRTYFTKRQLSRAVGAGAVVRSARGIYSLGALGDAERLSLEARAALFGRSAALAHGLGILHQPPAVELAVPRGRRVRRIPGTAIATRLLPPADLVGVGAVRATSPVRTVLDCAAMLPFAEGLAIADSALRQGLANREELEAGAGQWVGRNKAALRRVLRHMDPRAANAFESGLRAACLEAGVHMEPQATIRTARRDYRVDLAKKLRLVAEADSFEWHGGREALHRDCTRYNELVRAGCTVLRFSWEHVMYEREWIGEVVSEVESRAEVHNSRLVLPRSLPLTA